MPVAAPDDGISGGKVPIVVWVRREVVEGSPFDPLSWFEAFDGAGQPHEHAAELVAGRHVVHDDAPPIVVDPFDPSLGDTPVMSVTRAYLPWTVQSLLDNSYY